jgi:hypothetical protein
VQRAACELHGIGQNLIPFKKKHSDIIEMYQYEFELFLHFYFKTLNLYDIAQRKLVELSMPLDGAELCEGILHLMAGVKVTTARGIDCIDGTPMCFFDDAAFVRLFKTQSRNYCFAMKSLIGKDSKRPIDSFAIFFAFFEGVKKFGLPESELCPLIPLIIAKSQQDLSSIWKCLNTGCGVRKNGDTYYCHVCISNGNSIVCF